MAVFTGDRTLLFRHPAPPEGFSPTEYGGMAFAVFHGRFPGVVSNSIVELGGELVATLLTDGSGGERSPTALAAVALHEAFHVYQRTHHPGWVANEGDLLLYPMDRPELVALRFLETEALARALRARDSEERECWTREALTARRTRFAEMAPPFVTYERHSELNEGLAQYIQYRAEGAPAPSLPEHGFLPQAIRSQSYAHGAAFAFLLDDLGPGWKETLGTDGEPALDKILAEAVNPAAARGAPVPGDHAVVVPATCGFNESARSAADERARRAVAMVAAERTQRREAFEALPGWRVIVETEDGAPLGLRGFDPMNILVLPDGLHHTRLLHLGNEAGEIRMVREGGVAVEAITEGAGSHPLFQGIRRVVVAGLGGNDLHLDESEGLVEIRGTGFELRFMGATLERDGKRLRVVLSATVPSVHDARRQARLTPSCGSTTGDITQDNRTVL